MVEGYLGELTQMELIEDILLEIRGASGTLRVELSRKDLENMLKGKKTTKS